MSLIKDFKAFIMRGNVVELAVAVIIGAAFGAIVSSLVDHVFTPLILTPALKIARLDNIDGLHWGAVKYGLFLSNVIKFVVIAFILFLIIKGVQRFQKKQVAAPPEPTPTEKLLAQILEEMKLANKK
jgi:large conductance mechanosensitive channel